MLLTTPLFSITPNRNRLGVGPVHGVSRRKERSVGIVKAVQKVAIVFEPFEEVKSDNFILPISSQVSLARHNFFDDCEAAINEQIKEFSFLPILLHPLHVEYSVSYVYHSLYAYFDRDNVSLKGIAKFFKQSSEEERVHAEQLMTYQNLRGGRVLLHSILMPSTEYEHVEKGDALHAMELALSLEKLVNQKLLNLHSAAVKNNDHHLQEFLESKFLKEQVDAIKKISSYVTQLRMVGKGHGVWHFDQVLLKEGN